jgi:N-methylhydantoinase B
MSKQAIQLEIFKSLFSAVAEEMGTVLRRSSYSANIKERRDFSCALFDARGRMIAQAAHIPVHLGSMPLSVRAAIAHFPQGLERGDVVILNDPFHGGTHLPDITMVSPVYPSAGPARSRSGAHLLGYVAARAHHADVGGMTPGSMPVGREIYQEGLIIPPIRLVRGGMMDPSVLELILANVRTPQERRGDLDAQLAANARGEERLAGLAERYGMEQIEQVMGQLLAYSERMTRRLLRSLPDGTYRFQDFLDDDGVGNRPVRIAAAVTIRGERAVVDFSRTDAQQPGSVNAVEAITLSAVHYVFRCLLDLDVPDNDGCLLPVRVIAPAGSVVNALPPAAVAGGNVETSQRIVDVLFGALAQACPDKVPSASQGTMNNLTIGGIDPASLQPFTYYETIGGGTGARPDADGASAVHSHMTNTLNTPIEALEYAYPLRVRRYGLRRGSGGKGAYRGGDGILRELEVLADCRLTLLSDRRKFPPYGLAGGEPGKCGENRLLRNGKWRTLPGKGTIDLLQGDILSIRTPGGGGYGERRR